MPRNGHARRSLGPFPLKTIQESRILLVGAGGIGCELLKNLVLSGFGEIHIVDLDTIDLSNLNRQFLFRHEHIKKSKALVAKESAARFNPHVKLEAHHGNIKESQFNIDWFSKFNVVFNALDNLDARRHVNKMCLAAGVPLIESGTTGFNGQVQVIIKGKTECYDCNTKETPKSFPVCTIRSTPSQPIHCIVWGKSYLFQEIFGTSEDEAAELDVTEDSENAQEIANLRQEAQALQAIRLSMGSEDFPRKVFDKVFKDDIERLKSMEDMWKSRKPPTSLDFDALEKLATESNVLPSVCRQGQKAWNQAENFIVFRDSLKRLSDRFQVLQNSAGESPAPTLEFDKDDEDALDFVAASANLRALIFDIDAKSKFDIKQMAGNIIPAIATTNAMIAGLCVLQAFKIFRNDMQRAKNVFLERGSQRVINTEALRPPNPNCSVCSVTTGKLSIDPSRATLEHLVKDVLGKQLGYGELTLNSSAGTVYDPDLEDNLPKKLSELGINIDDFITIIDDEDDNPRVNLSLAITQQLSTDDTSPPVSLPTELTVPRKPKVDPAQASLTNGVANGHITNDVSAENKKRKRGPEDDEVAEITPKKGKVVDPAATENGISKEQSLTITDSGNGVIEID